MVKWEYTADTVDHDGGWLDLNAMGDEGWELVAVVGWPHYTAFYFKRLKQSTQDWPKQD